MQGGTTSAIDSFETEEFSLFQSKFEEVVTMEAISEEISEVSVSDIEKVFLNQFYFYIDSISLKYGLYSKNCASSRSILRK